MNAYRANLPLFAVDDNLERPTFDKPGGATHCPACGKGIGSVSGYIRFHDGPHGLVSRCRIRGPHLHQRCEDQYMGRQRLRRQVEHHHEGDGVKKTTSYQLAQAIADKLAIYAYEDIADTWVYSSQEQRDELSRIVNAHLYVAAHQAIVGEMRAAAKARKASK